MPAPERIAPSFREKIWGSTGLAPWFPDPQTRIGEVWFESDGRLPLIKFLFTTERLSVQVHPDDEYARSNGGGCGKTEMWHVLRAAPAARLAVGFREPTAAEVARHAAQTGTIEALLNWIPVRPGDTVFVPARTVHAIGAGLVLCEIQQNSDITYRLFDYGRGRALHLEEAFAVAALGPVLARSALPVRCPYFHTEGVHLSGELTLSALPVPTALIVLSGEGMVEGEPFLPGDVFELPPAEPALLRGRGEFLRTYIPGNAAR